MSFNDILTDYLETLRVAGYARKTLRHKQTSVEELIEYLQSKAIEQPQQIDAGVIIEYQERLRARGIGSVHIANKHTDCRRFLKYLYEERYTADNHGSAFGKVIKKKTPKVALTRDEAALLLMQPDITTQRGIRDRALLELLYSSGLRREELVRIELYDLDMQAGTVKVTGKGDKQRIVPVGRMALYWIHKYLKDVRGTVKDPHLFVGMKTRRSMCTEHISFLVRLCGIKSGIKKEITAHGLRHACATHMMQNGASSVMIQSFLGHEQLMTTQIYTHVLDEDLRKVIEKYHPRPWMKIDGGATTKTCKEERRVQIGKHQPEGECESAQRSRRQTRLLKDRTELQRTDSPSYGSQTDEERQNPDE